MLSCLATILDSQNVENCDKWKRAGEVVGTVGQIFNPPLPPSFLAFLPDSSWQLINAWWNIQHSLTQNTPTLKATFFRTMNDNQALGKRRLFLNSSSSCEVFAETNQSYFYF